MTNHAISFVHPLIVFMKRLYLNAMSVTNGAFYVRIKTLSRSISN